MSTLLTLVLGCASAVELGAVAALPSAVAVGNLAAAADAVKAENSGWQVALFNLILDGESLGVSRVLRDGKGRVLVALEDLGERLLIPASVPRVEMGGVVHIELNDFDALVFRIDPWEQALVLAGLPAAYRETRIDGRLIRYEEASPAPPGGFLNYDLNVAQTEGDRRMGGALEMGWFQGQWIASNTAFAADLTGGGPWTRLESTWTLNRPEALARWRVGDSVAMTGSLGRAVRFAGVQWATDFTIRPDLVTYPLPTLRGEAGLPSILDLYLGEALRLRREVGTGPFVITQPPLSSGGGSLDLVLTDSFGEQRSISQDFYVGTELLRDGLHSHSVQVGFLRRDFGLRSADYGRLFAGGAYRLGLTDQVTGELFAEATEGHAMAGLGAG